jgi:hypothetical protein
MARKSVSRKSVSRKSVSRKSVSRKKNKRNKSKRRQRRITRQIGGDISDMERYILGLKKEYTPDIDTRTEEKKWVEINFKTDEDKVLYAGALVSNFRPQDKATANLLEPERKQKIEAFNDGLNEIYANYDVTDEERKETLEYLEEEGLFDDEDYSRYDKLRGIAKKIYQMFAKT